MAIPKLETDVKIVSKIPNYPGSEGGLTPEEFKQKFDEAPQIIKDYINKILIPEMDKTVDVQALLNGILDSTLTQADKAAQAKVVGDALNGKLSKSGGTMTGTVDMAGNAIVNLPEPSGAAEPATKAYVDSRRFTATVSLSKDNWTGQANGPWFQTVAIDGVTEDGSLTDVFASPEASEENFSAYSECAVRLYAQHDDELEFVCSAIPDQDVTVRLMIFVNAPVPVSTFGLLNLTDPGDYPVNCSLDGEEYGVSNATVNEQPTKETYDFTVL